MQQNQVTVMCVNKRLICDGAKFSTMTPVTIHVHQQLICVHYAISGNNLAISTFSPISFSPLLFVCVCVCVCVLEREREREGGRESVCVCVDRMNF